MNGDVKMDVQLDVPTEGYAGRIEVVAGPTGRRRRADAEKARIAAESLIPGAVVTDIARRYGVTRWQIYDWRRRFQHGLLPAAPEEVCTPAFIPVSVVEETQVAADHDIIEVVIDGILIRAGRNAGEAHLARIFRAARASS